VAVEVEEVRVVLKKAVQKARVVVGVEEDVWSDWLSFLF